MFLKEPVIFRVPEIIHFSEEGFSFFESAGFTKEVDVGGVSFPVIGMLTDKFMDSVKGFRDFIFQIIGIRLSV